MTQHIAFITGAMGGLGTAFCQAFDKAGYKVVAAYHPEFDDKDAWLAEQKAEGFTNFIPVACDVGNYESCVAAAAEAEKLAGGVVDVLVNNAGITRDSMVHKMTPAQWKEVIDTNLTGVFNMTHPLWSGMRDRKFGRIINISSINGQKGQAGQANYSAAKAGDMGFTKALAQEGARAGITVNAICPGYIGTEMVRAIDEKVLNERIIPQIPVGRLGEPEEIARCVVFLASDDAGFITGSTISANGGQYFS